MSEENKPKTVDYSSNSKSAKKNEEVQRVVPNVVVTGPVVERKKTLGRKFREQFAGDDAQTVGQYVLIDVILPAVKNLIFDMVTEGVKRSLFGGTRPNSVGNSTVMSGRTNYSSYSGGRQTSIVAPGSPASREMTPQQRAMHDFSGVILATRGEAEEVIDVLANLIDEYGTATVNDFYTCIGQTSEFTAVKYGWKSLAQAQVRGVREGFLLELPRPIVLE